MAHARLIALAACALALPATADIAAIRVEALPKDLAVLEAVRDATQLEPFTRAWSSRWNHPISQGEVVNRPRP